MALEDEPTVEEIAIKSLRNRIQDIISEDKRFDDDLYLLQWLKAHKLDPVNTEPVIRKSIQWRKEMDVESIDDAVFQEFRRVYAAAWGTARDGRLVAYNPIGRKDYKKGIATYGKSLWLQLWTKLFLQMEDRMIAYNREKNANGSRITVHSAECMINIQDIKNFSALQLANIDVIKAGRENVKNLSTHFPVMIELSLMINMNRVFRALLKIVKPFLDKPYFTYEIFGSEESEWRERLLEIMDEEQLQIFLESD